MSERFDELSRAVAESVSRREALRKLGTGLVSILLAALGLHGRAHAGGRCTTDADCGASQTCCDGRCSSLHDDANCGFCGNVCGAGMRCRVTRCGGEYGGRPTRCFVCG
jgi:hypothetical protein